ncbi:hypothetical protein I4U23_016383 [Adineta vaga]|nr:hypothetical protein I4U23_016383 [Adineta vaga]
MITGKFISVPSDEGATENLKPSDGRRRIELQKMQTVVAVWLDKHFDRNNEDCRNRIQQFQSVVNHINVFTDNDGCIEFILEIDDKKVFMIISESVAQSLVPCIHDIRQLNSIFIFRHKKQLYEGWTKDWPKIRGVFTDISSLCQAIKEATDQTEQNAIPMSFMASGKREKRDLPLFRAQSNVNNPDLVEEKVRAPTSFATKYMSYEARLKDFTSLALIEKTVPSQIKLSVPVLKYNYYQQLNSLSQIPNTIPNLFDNYLAHIYLTSILEQLHTISSKNPTDPTFRLYTAVQAQTYAAKRGSYSKELYDIVLNYHSRTGGQFNQLVDVGCGPGNITRDLSVFFDCASGGVRAGTVDLLTAGMAAHWFDMGTFWAEAATVLKPDGSVALWMLASLYCHPSTPNAAEVQRVLFNLEHEILTPFELPSNLPPVTAFSPSDFVRYEWDRNGILNDGNSFFGDTEECFLDDLEKKLSTASIVTRWREANPEEALGGQTSFIQGAGTEIESNIKNLDAEIERKQKICSDRAKEIDGKEKKLDDDIINQTIDQQTAVKKDEEIQQLLAIQSEEQGHINLLKDEKDKELEKLNKVQEDLHHKN